MRLNKTHKHTLVKFALERTTIDPKEQAKHDAIVKKVTVESGKYFARLIGPDLPVLKRHKVVQEVVRFYCRENFKDDSGLERHKDYLVVLGIGNNIWAIKPGWGTPYYNVPKRLLDLAKKYTASASNIRNLELERKENFYALINKVTTFKKAVELWPEWENAAHLIYANTSLTVQSSELIKRVNQYKIKVPDDQ